MHGLRSEVRSPDGRCTFIVRKSEWKEMVSGWKK